MLLWLGLAVLLGGMAWVRLAPLDPADWHLDPELVAPRTSPNEYRHPPAGTAPDVWATDPVTLADRMIDAALAEPRTRVMAGGPETGLVTLVQRSALFGFPDVITIETAPVQGGAALTVWSRSVYGYGDQGVNAARVARWLAAGTKGLARP
jgi:hypothetical protein